MSDNRTTGYVRDITMACQRCPGSPVSKVRTRHLCAEQANQPMKLGRLSATATIYEQQINTKEHEDLNSNCHFATSLPQSDNILPKNANNMPSRSHCRKCFCKINNLLPTSPPGQINQETINCLLPTTTNILQKKIPALPTKSTNENNLSEGFNDLSSSPTTDNIFLRRTKDSSIQLKSGTIIPGNINASTLKSTSARIFSGSYSSLSPDLSTLKTLSRSRHAVYLTSTTSQIITSEINGSLSASTEKIISAEINDSIQQIHPLNSNKIISSETNDILPYSSSMIAQEKMNNFSVTTTTNTITSAETKDILLTSTTKNITSADPNNLPITPTTKNITSADPNNLPITPTTKNISSADTNNLPITPTTKNISSADTNNLPITPTTKNISSADTNNLPITPTTKNITSKKANALSSASADQIISTNFNTWSTSTSLRQNTAYRSPHKKEDNSGHIPHFQGLPTIYASDSQTPTTRTGKSNVHQNDNSDNIHNFKPKKKQSSRNISSPSTIRHNFQRPFYSQNVRRKDIVFEEVIGNGGFGKVYKGMIHGNQVAIKVVQKRRGSGIHREILQAERLAFSLNLRHNNIVSILALNLCDGLRGDALIVMELASPQTLQSVLDDHTKPVSQSQRLQFALQISEALSYLHGNDVAHLDIKPRNVLLTSDHTCKLADFGSLTRVRKDGPREDTEYTQLLGTLPYRAPELMKGCYPSCKADIFSLGITFWQMVTREVPHGGANPHWLIYQVTKNNMRPDHHDTGSDILEVKYRDLYTCCWGADPLFRPNAVDVIILLSPMFQSSYNGAWSDAINRND